jgi:hypothetical protein
MTWNDFLIYLNAHNVTEMDFWIFVVLSILGVAIIVFAWHSWAVIHKEKVLPDASALICAIVLTGFIGPLLLMGLVHLIQFFI